MLDEAALQTGALREILEVDLTGAAEDEFLHRSRCLPAGADDVEAVLEADDVGTGRQVVPQLWVHQPGDADERARPLVRLPGGEPVDSLGVGGLAEPGVERPRLGDVYVQHHVILSQLLGGRDHGGVVVRRGDGPDPLELKPPE